MLFDAGFTKHSGQEVVTVECYYNAEASRWSGWFIVKLKCGINLSVETFDNAKIYSRFCLFRQKFAKALFRNNGI